MKLYASATSPFARKVRIALIELGLADRVALVAANPLENAELRKLNPLAKIPVLVLDDGSALYDSGVIVEYLDALDGRARLLPCDRSGQIAELRLHALADGILDAAVSIAFELRRPAEQQSTLWIERWRETVVTGAAALAAKLSPTTFGLAGITAAAAADYVAFRLPDVKIPALAVWRRQFDGRVSLKATAPESDLIPA